MPTSTLTLSDAEDGDHPLSSPPEGLLKSLLDCQVKWNSWCMRLTAFVGWLTATAAVNGYNTFLSVSFHEAIGIAALPLDYLTQSD